LAGVDVIARTAGAAGAQAPAPRVPGQDSTGPPRPPANAPGRVEPSSAPAPPRAAPCGAPGAPEGGPRLLVDVAGARRAAGNVTVTLYGPRREDFLAPGGKPGRPPRRAPAGRAR